MNVSRTYGGGDTGDRMIFQTTNSTRHMYQNRANTFEMDNLSVDERANRRDVVSK
jgi:hypothetical protein